MHGIPDFCVGLEDPLLSYSQQMFGFFFLIGCIAHFPTVFNRHLEHLLTEKCSLFMCAMLLRVCHCTGWEYISFALHLCTLNSVHTGLYTEKKNNEIALCYSRHSRRHLLQHITTSHGKQLCLSLRTSAGCCRVGPCLIWMSSLSKYPRKIRTWP